MQLRLLWIDASEWRGWKKADLSFSQCDVFADTLAAYRFCIVRKKVCGSSAFITDLSDNLPVAEWTNFNTAILTSAHQTGEEIFYTISTE